MRIRILTCSVGANFVRNRDDELDLTDAEAGRLIAAGIAERIAEPKRQPVTPGKAKASQKGSKGKRSRRVADDPAAVAPETTDNPEA